MINVKTANLFIVIVIVIVIVIASIHFMVIQISTEKASSFLGNNLVISGNIKLWGHYKLYAPHCKVKQDVREAYALFFSVTRMRSSNSARINKFDF